jgi:nucleoside-diphosphate-sugar epimerase
MVAEGLDVVHVCPGAVYGPSPVNVALNSLFLKLLNRQAPVLPPFGMSYVFVEGLAEAHLAAAEKGQAGERYLVADGYASNRELARAILSEAGRPRLPPTAPLWLLSAVAGAGEWAAARFGIDPLVSKGELALLAWDVRVDARKAREHLGFRPTPLADGVSKTVAHMRAQGLVPQS